MPLYATLEAQQAQITALDAETDEQRGALVQLREKYAAGKARLGVLRGKWEGKREEKARALELAERAAGEVERMKGEAAELARLRERLAKVEEEAAKAGEEKRKYYDKVRWLSFFFFFFECGCVCVCELKVSLW